RADDDRVGAAQRLRRQANAERPGRDGSDGERVEGPVVEGPGNPIGGAAGDVDRVGRLDTVGAALDDRHARDDAPWPDGRHAELGRRGESAALDGEDVVDAVAEAAGRDEGRGYARSKAEYGGVRRGPRGDGRRGIVVEDGAREIGP